MEQFKHHRFLNRLDLSQGTPPGQFILYNHVSDNYYYGRGGLMFLPMRETLVQYLKSVGYEIIAFYSVSHGITFAENQMQQRYMNLLTTPVTDDYLDGSNNGSGASNRPPAPPQQQGGSVNDFNALTRLLNQENVQSAVIIERAQNLVGQPGREEYSIIVDHIQNWSSLTNGNVSLLVVDNEEISTLPTELVGKHRSGVELINVGLPNAEEINQLFISAEVDNTKISKEQRADLIHRLSDCDCMKILDYFKKCRGQNLELNMRTLRNLMSKTEDIWPQLLTGEKIAALRGKLKERLLGQDFVINKLTETLIRVRHNIEEQRNSGKIDEKPLAYFFFAGPTGVGKTEVFRILSDELKGIRSKKINMPEYKEEHAVSRLFGAPPGYVGYGKGELGQFLLDNPASIILFDEFEKAHEKIWQNFLTMLEGSLTTGDGVKIDLSQTILFFTSNAGASDLVRIESNMSEGQQENIRRQNTQIVRNALRQSGAAPELIGRLLEAIMPFNHLTREVASGIIDLNLKKISEKLARSGYEIEFHPSVKDYMLAFYERERASGARAIANHIEGTLYGEILSRLSGG
jgi:hypothetical protein